MSGAHTALLKPWAAMGFALTTTTWTAALTPCTTHITTEAWAFVPGEGLRLHARTLRWTSLMKQLAAFIGRGSKTKKQNCHHYRPRQHKQINRMDASGGLLCSCLCYCCSAPACATADV